MSAGITETAKMQIVPYLYLYGRTEEALEFYKSVFGGSYELSRHENSPKVMHASFTAPGVAFLCSDGRPGNEHDVDPDEGNVSLALSVTDKAEADRIFAALSQGGSVKMPLDDAFWGGRFGVIHDKFGTEWMVTAP